MIRIKINQKIQFESRNMQLVSNVRCYISICTGYTVLFRVLKYKKQRWTGREGRMERTRNAYRIFVEKFFRHFEERETCGRITLKCIFKEVGCEDGRFGVGVQWRAVWLTLQTRKERS